MILLVVIEDRRLLVVRKNFIFMQQHYIPLKRTDSAAQWYIFRDMLATGAVNDKEAEESGPEPEPEPEPELELRNFDMLSPWLPKFCKRTLDLPWPEMRDGENAL